MVTLTLPGALSKLLPVPLPFLETLCLLFGYRHFGMFCTGLHLIEGAGGMWNVVFSMIQSSGVWWCLLVLHRPWDSPISCAIWEPYLPWQDMNRQLHKNIKDSAGDCEAMRFEELPHDWNWNRRTENGRHFGITEQKTEKFYSPARYLRFTGVGLGMTKLPEIDSTFVPTGEVEFLLPGAVLATLHSHIWMPTVGVWLETEWSCPSLLLSEWFSAELDVEMLEMSLGNAETCWIWGHWYHCALGNWFGFFGHCWYGGWCLWGSSCILKISDVSKIRD